MTFTLEALDARQGDALMLHWGEDGLAVVDGGPPGVFSRVLRPRLEALRRERETDVLPISLLMVSHIDDDHIHGVLDLTRHLADLRKEKRPLPWQIQALWHNAFDDIVGNVDPLSRALGAAVGPGVAGGDVPTGPAPDRYSALIVASVAQGAQLRDDARALGLSINRPWNGGVVWSPSSGATAIRQDGGLTLTVVGPRQSDVEALQAEWDRARAEMRKKASAARAIAAEFVDTSVYRLSSIVVLASLGGRRMLLTGDARGDVIIEGLQAAGLLGGGTMHLDLLKVPHHGSARNVTADFFRRVTADHYVISADGRHDNPDPEMLRMLTAARGAAEYALHFTNRVPAVEEYLRHDRGRGRRRYQIVYRADDASSVPVSLLAGDTPAVTPAPAGRRRRRGAAPKEEAAVSVPAPAEPTPVAAAPMPPLDLPALAFRLVVARHAAPGILLHLEMGAIADAARKVNRGARTATDLAEVHRTLEAHQAGIAANPLWLAWVEATRGAALRAGLPGEASSPDPGTASPPRP